MNQAETGVPSPVVLVILSDWLIIRVTANPGEGFLDHMISPHRRGKAAENPERNCPEYPPYRPYSDFYCRLRDTLGFFDYSVETAGYGQVITVTMLIALLVCLAPTTIGGLLNAIGIAGMDRLIRRNVITTSGRAIEAAGDVDVLLLDKTGTITLGNRQAVELIPVDGPILTSLPKQPSSPPLLMKRPRGGVLSCWSRNSTASVAAVWVPTNRPRNAVYPVFKPYPDERSRHRGQPPSGKEQPMQLPII